MARRSAALVSLLLVGAMLRAAAEKPQRWREIGVSDIDPSKRVHAKLVWTQDMAFLWGGTQGDKGQVN